MHGQQRVALQRMLACLLAAALPRGTLHPAQCVTGTYACKCDSTNGKPTICCNGAEVLHNVFGVDGRLCQEPHADRLATAMSRLTFEVTVVQHKACTSSCNASHAFGS